MHMHKDVCIYKGLGALNIMLEHRTLFLLIVYSRLTWDTALRYNADPSFMCKLVA